ncbi:extracellular solute-binding protein [Notoacmeibacter sp. MSK16QG-6]|uniref:extracellular solute-binding protein n=1 Tax=Notoacmeibacter sp. MSK16QG-6 TaxID=2957982 RepID=UPI00209CAAF0|nr:extracellular solute-binding protein [Notoacmeibacter sp. MSK16QG-6]MCP1198748.1 extracellular solute-binding protein [Notoacmeibacter sp. MSK16QG-6]
MTERWRHKDRRTIKGFEGTSLDRRSLLIAGGCGVASLATFGLPSDALAQAETIANPALPAADIREALPWHHATTLLGEPKYEEGFDHFAYVNPGAPKGGVVRQGSIGSYDSFNPIVPKGEVGDGLGLIYETLFTSALDELDISAMYGLLADAIRYPDDFSWVSYRMNPDARWHDGEPVKASDVIWSFNKLKELHPQYRFYYANVVEAVESAPGEVTFLFNERNNRELPHIVGQVLVLPQHWWEGEDGNGRKRDIASTTLERPLGSGPYRIGAFSAGQTLVYDRVEDYWGRDLPVNVGSNNFGQIRYEYFRDQVAMIQALKAGKLDFRSENSATTWNTAYTENLFPARRKGYVDLKIVPDKASGVMQAFVPNMRRKKFQDSRVRRAISYCFDFETLNRTIFYGMYLRPDSFFAGTELASSGLPQGMERDILEKYRADLPESVFTDVFTNPIGGSNSAMRKNLRIALDLFKEAGYELRNRRLVNAQTGEPFGFEVLYASESSARVITPLQQSLRRLGVDVSLRLMEPNAYLERIRNFDYDMITSAWGQSLSPGNEQRNYWGSGSKDTPGSRNYAGIADLGIDALIDEVIFSETREHLVAATRALDRALLHHHYVIPQLYYPFDRLIVWNRIKGPDPLPEFSVGFPTVWWEDQANAEAIDAGLKDLPEPPEPPEDG